MRRHEVSRTRDNNTEDSHKAGRERRQQNRRLSAHQSATSTTEDLNRFSILCAPQKYTTCPDVHCSACLKHSNFLNRSKSTKGTGIQTIQIPTRSVHQTFRPSSYRNCAVNIHVPALAEQSLGESVTAISPSTPQRPGLSECLEALFPMECVPEISLCLEPALNRGSLH